MSAPASISNLAMASPPAFASAAAVSPKAVAAPFDEPAFVPPAPKLAGLASAGSALSFDDEVDAFEANDGFSKNASTFLVAASSAIHSPVSTASIPTT